MSSSYLTWLTSRVEGVGFSVTMARKHNHDVIKAFHRLTDAAEAYVNRSPRVKRIQAERSTLLDAIANAQLVLSVHQLPKETASERPSKSQKDKRRR